MSRESELQSLLRWLAGARWQGRALSDFALAVGASGFTREGTPNLLLAIPCGGYHGLWLDVSIVETAKPSFSRLEVVAMLRSQGFRVDLCCGVDSARTAVERYLGPSAAVVSRAG